MEALARETLERWGQIDILVNNAGALLSRRLLKTSNSEWRTVIGTNLDGVFYCIRTIVPTMVERGRGSVINIGSDRAESTSKNAAAYSASKAALNRLTVKLATEVRDDGVSVNVLQPGHVLTRGVLLSRPKLDSSGLLLPDAPEKKIVAASIHLAAHAADPDRFFSGDVVHESDFGVSWP